MREGGEALFHDIRRKRTFPSQMLPGTSPKLAFEDGKQCLLGRLGLDGRMLPPGKPTIKTIGKQQASLCYRQPRSL